MADPHVISGLVKVRARLGGDLRRIEKQRRELKAKLASVDETLKLIGFQDDPAQIAPRASYTRLFKRGELFRLVADALRTATGPISNREIAAIVVQKRGWDARDPELASRIAESIKPVRRGLLNAAKNVTGQVVWRSENDANEPIHAQDSPE